MAKKSENFSEENLKSKLRNLYCDVCGQVYRLPRILPCLHSFCTECILNLPTRARNDDVMWEDREDVYGVSIPQNRATNATASYYQTNSGGRDFRSLSNRSPRSRIRNAASEEHLMSVPLPFRAMSGSRLVNKHALLTHKGIHRSASCKEEEFFPQYSTLSRNRGSTSHSRNSDIYRVSSLRDESGFQGRKSVSYSSVVTFSAPESRRFSRSGNRRSSNGLVQARSRVIVCPKCSREATVSADLHELPRNFILERLLRKVKLHNPEMMSSELSLYNGTSQYFPKSQGDIFVEVDNKKSIPDYENIEKVNDANEPEDARLCSNFSSAEENPKHFEDIAHQNAQRAEQYETAKLRAFKTTGSFSETNELEENLEAQLNPNAESFPDEDKKKEEKDHEGNAKQESHTKEKTSKRIVKKLKLPKLYHFGKFFGCSSGASSRDGSDMKNKPIDPSIEHNKSQKKTTSNVPESSAVLYHDSEVKNELDIYKDSFINENIDKNIIDKPNDKHIDNRKMGSNTISGSIDNVNDDVFVEVNSNSNNNINISSSSSSSKNTNDQCSFNNRTVPENTNVRATIVSSHNYNGSSKTGMASSNIHQSWNNTLHTSPDNTDSYHNLHHDYDESSSGNEYHISCTASTDPVVKGVIGAKMERSHDTGSAIGAKMERSHDTKSVIGAEMERRLETGSVIGAETEESFDSGVRDDISLSRSELDCRANSWYNDSVFTSHTLPRRSAQVGSVDMGGSGVFDINLTQHDGAAHPASLDFSRAPWPVTCEAHPGQELTQFCLDCEECVCRGCALTRHSAHVYRPLSTHLFKEQMAEVDKLIRKAVPKVKHVEQRLFDLEQYRVNAKDRALEVTAEINEFVDLYLDAVEKHRVNLLSRVAELEQAREASLSEAKDHLGLIHTDVQETCRFVAELLRGASSDTEILSVKRLITQRLSSLLETPVEETRELSSFLKFNAVEKGDIINNFQLFGRVVDQKVSAATSYISGDGLSLVRVGRVSTLRLTVCGEDGVPCYGSDVFVKAWLCPFREQFNSASDTPVNVERIEGKYQLKFTPDTKGLHLLHVALNGESIKGSPFKFNVKSRWRQHQGTWHCCTVCSTDGRPDVPCGCGGIVGDGYLGCCHGSPGHPGGHHWSCCGKMTIESECGLVLAPTATGTVRTAPSVIQFSL